MLEQFLHRIFYGLLSGLTEFLPVGSYPHQAFYKHMTGFQPEDPWLKVAVLIGCFAAVVFCCFSQIKKLLHENKLSKQARRRNHPVEKASLQTIRLCRTALIPVIVVVWFYSLLLKYLAGFAPLVITLFLNGLLIFIPRLIPSGDKTGGACSKLDGILIGFAATLGFIPGFSRVGSIISVGQIRGGKRSYFAEIALLISVTPLLCLLILSILGAAVSVTELSTTLIVADVVACFVSFGGSCAGIWLLRVLSTRRGLGFFAYYSWAASIISLILYMIT